MAKNARFDEFSLSDLLYSKFTVVQQYEKEVISCEDNIKEYQERELKRIAEIREEHSDLSETEISEFVSGDWRIEDLRENIRRCHARIYILKSISDFVVNI